MNTPNTPASYDIHDPFTGKVIKTVTTTTPGNALDNVPALLKSLRNWVTWKLIDVDGKPTKIPFIPGTDFGASSTNPTTWRPFEDVKNYPLNHVEGIGFMTPATREFTGIDLDNCRDPKTGEVADWALDVVRLLNSYTEITPSETGLRVWVEGTWGADYKNGFNLSPDCGMTGDKVTKIEVYGHSRYFTVTGNVFESYTDIRKRDLTAAYELICRIKAQHPLAAKTNDKDHVESGTSPGASVQIERTGTVISPKSAILMHGEITSTKPFRIEYAGNALNYGSQSEADMALCSLLVLDGLDDEQIDAELRKSALYRPKWEREDYRDRTISKARTEPRRWDTAPVTEARVDSESTSAIEVKEPEAAPELGPSSDLIMPDSAMTSTRLGDIYADKFAPHGFPLGMALPALVTAASVRVPMLPSEPGIIRGDNTMVNLFAAPIGPVGCGKSQVIEWACNALNIRNPEGISRYYLETKAGSSELLLKHLKAEMKRTIPLASNFLINPDEWAFLFAKAGVPHSSFATFLTTSFYRRRQSFEVGNRVGRVDLNNAISFIAGIVESDFDTVFGASSIGGLYDRFLFGYAPGWQWDYRAYPYEITLEDLSWTPTPVRCDDSVWEVMKAWNRKNKGIGRIPELCVRIATIFASMDGRPVLYGRDLEKLEGLARNQAAIRTMFHPNAGLTYDAVFGNAAINWLTAHTHGEWVNITALKTGVHAYEMKLGPNVAERALQSLARGGRIELWLAKTTGVDPVPADWKGARPRVGLVRLLK